MIPVVQMIVHYYFKSTEYTSKILKTENEWFSIVRTSQRYLYNLIQSEIKFIHL